jgi:hypothetical protein
MTPENNGVLLAIGMSRSGKTFALKHELSEWLDAGGRALVIDVVNDWPGELDWDGACATAANADNARRLIRSGWRCVILQPGKPTFHAIRAKASNDAPLIEHAADIVLSESTKQSPIALVISEAHLQIPQPGAMGEQTWHLLTAYRHYGAAIMLDSQRPVAVSMRARSQVSRLYLFAMVSDADFAWVRELGNQPLVDAVKECAKRFEAGDSGWHVLIDPRSPIPPYDVTIIGGE